MTAPPMRQLKLCLLPLGGDGQFTTALMLVPVCPHDGCGWSMPDLFGAKARARIAAMVRKVRESRPRPALRPIPGGAPS